MVMKNTFGVVLFAVGVPGTQHVHKEMRESWLPGTRAEWHDAKTASSLVFHFQEATFGDVAVKR